MYGGGFYLNSNSTIKINSQIITFLNNTSNEDGGAIFTESINSFKIDAG